MRSSSEKQVTVLNEFAKCGVFCDNKPVHKKKHLKPRTLFVLELIFSLFNFHSRPFTLFPLLLLSNCSLHHHVLVAVVDVSLFVWVQHVLALSLVVVVEELGVNQNPHDDVPNPRCH